MAYISTQTVKEIRQEIKKTLTAKDGFKLSITNEHYSTVRVSLRQVPKEMAINEDQTQINNYYLKNIECENTKTIFQIVDKIINRITGGNYDRNAGDLGADYSDCNFYKSYRVGEWNEKCIIK